MPKSTIIRKCKNQVKVNGDQKSCKYKGNEKRNIFPPDEEKKVLKIKHHREEYFSVQERILQKPVIRSKCADIAEEDYFYNLKKLAEITLAYFNNNISSVSQHIDYKHRNAIEHNHNWDYRCWDCGKTYSTSSNLARHKQTHRSLADQKAKRCSYCGKIYVSIPAYSMHLRTHSQNFKCHHCGKCFSRPWLLQGHIRTHTGEKPFKCSICEKSFADKSNLRAHTQIHSNAKPHICQQCGKSFALRSYLYKHEETFCNNIRKGDDENKI